MKRLLIFLLCSVLAFSSLSFSVGAAELTGNSNSAAPEIVEEGADIDAVATGATADELSPSGYTLLSEAQFQSKLKALRVKYPHGSTWEGVYYEYGSAKAWTCWAYAAQMMYEVFGARFYADGLLDNKFYNPYAVNAGDWVRIDGDSHSIFITKVNDDGVYYTDGNGTGVYNQIRWDGYFSWSEFYNRFSYGVYLPGNDLTGEIEVVNHTVSYNANGGSGSMSSQTVPTGSGFSVKANGFSRPGYTFAGYTVRRSYDSKWYVSGGKGWQSLSDIFDNDYDYSLYDPGESFYMSSNWLGNHTESTTFTFYAQWVPNQSNIEFAANYSGYNYMLGSDLGTNYDDYIYSRSSVYSVAVDSSERLNNANSLKITGKAAGSSASDLAFVTSTNEGFGTIYSTAGIAGDQKDYYLHFYAKASVDGAKMYFRWGYSDRTVSVTLMKNWNSYTVVIPKTRYYGYALHPYFNQAGTFYINSLALGDNSFTTNVVPETGTWAAASQTVTRGTAPQELPSVKRDGYTFLGWFTAAEGGRKITSDTPITASTVRLYAHWKKRASNTPVKTVKDRGHIYELYDNSLSWEEAAAFCETKGGHLVKINSAQENSTVFRMINDRQGYCWIGLSCTAPPSGWKWTDGTSTADYNNWYDPSYETVDTGEYYAMMYPLNYDVKAYAATWDKCIGSDYHCSYYGYYNSFYICEYDEPVFRGDTDCNGAIEAIDATLIQRSCAGLPTAIPSKSNNRGDVNDNGKLDLIDATCIQRYLLDLQTPYQVGEWIK